MKDFILIECSFTDKRCPITEQKTVDHTSNTVPFSFWLYNNLDSINHHLSSDANDWWLEYNNNKQLFATNTMNLDKLLLSFASRLTSSLFTTFGTKRFSFNTLLMLKTYTKEN